MPDKIGDFRATGKAVPSELGLPGIKALLDSSDYSTATRTYVSAKGGTFVFTLARARTEPAAYALLTRYAAEMKSKGTSLLKTDGVGTTGYSTPQQIVFFKGTALVSITAQASRKGQDQLTDFARSIAATLPSEENDIPALVKHLPDWETAQERAVFAVSKQALQEAAGNQLVLDAVDFTGGTEAVTATYDSSRLVIVEFSTPQLSIDNDARIEARIEKLEESGLPIPSAYRRVGNYSVFVFGAQDKQAAGQLIDRISYEKVVQWLGDNPRAWDRLEKEFNETTGGLIVGVIKASGFAALLSLAVGTVLGGLVFMRRRAQQATTDKYSDAGGMLRLNMDDLTPQTDPSRLLGKGDS
ncbi:MAG TPA: DUF6599 family protein [Pyrinomonadaceae bacterium]